MQSALASASFACFRQSLLAGVMACTCAIAAAQTTTTATTPAASSKPYIPSNGKTVIGRFAGLVLCANCPGIRTELSLFENIEDPFIKTFVMRETYLRSPLPATTIVSHGYWNVNRGRGDTEPDATVYVLEVDGASVSRFYLLQDRETLRMLDGDLGLLPPELPQTLHRLSPRKGKTPY